MSLCSDVRPYVFGPLLLDDLGADEPDVLAFGAAPVAADAPVAAPQPESEPAAPPIDMEAVRAAAWEAGLQQGYQQGLQQAAAEQEAATARLAALAEQAALDAHQFARTLEQQLVELALAVAARVVAREVERDPGLVVGVVRDTLAELQDATVVRVRVHPEDHALVEPHWESLRQQRGSEQGQLVADEHVRRGGCVVETAIGRVDGQLDTRLGQLAQAFEAVREGTL
jgi:flagellar assembly protein FliH